MLGHRLGRWLNIKTTINQRIVLAEERTQQPQDTESMLVLRWSNVVDGGTTLNQH